jgi:hypothetical protein
MSKLLENVLIQLKQLQLKLGGGTSTIKIKNLSFFKFIICIGNNRIKNLQKNQFNHARSYIIDSHKETKLVLGY